MIPDSNWLKVFDLKFEALAGVCAGSAVVLWLRKQNYLWLDALPTWALALLATAMVLSGSLLVFRVCSLLTFKAADFKRARALRNKQAKAKALYLEYFKTLSRDEREVLAYLVSNNQQSFTGALTAPRLATLKQKGFLVIGSGAATVFQVAYTVPPHIWAELMLRKDEFTLANPNIPPPWVQRLM